MNSLQSLTDSVTKATSGLTSGSGGLDLSGWTASSVAVTGVPEWVLPVAGFFAGAAALVAAKETGAAQLEEENAMLVKSIKDLKVAFEANYTAFEVQSETNLQVFGCPLFLCCVCRSTNAHW